MCAKRSHFSGKASWKCGRNQNWLSHFLAHAFQARGFIGRLSDDREFKTLWNTDVAVHDVAHVQSQSIADREIARLLTPFIECVDPLPGIPGCVEGAFARAFRRRAGLFQNLGCATDGENRKRRVADETTAEGREAGKKVSGLSSRPAGDEDPGPGKPGSAHTVKQRVSAMLHCVP